MSLFALSSPVLAKSKHQSRDGGGDFWFWNNAFSKGNGPDNCVEYYSWGYYGKKKRHSCWNWWCDDDDEPVDEAPEAVLYADPLEGYQPLKVWFSAKLSEDDYGVTSVSWDFGDGSYSTEDALWYEYTQPGDYTVTLTVWDWAGQSDTETLTVTVLPLPAQRVVEGILAYYDFSSGAGDTVFDRSQTGESINLLMDDPRKTAWLECGGLALEEPTMVQSYGSADKIINSVKHSHEITVELWVDPAETQPGDGGMLFQIATVGPNNAKLDVVRWNNLYRVRYRSKEHGKENKIYSSVGCAGSGLTHIVFTREHRHHKGRLYINGERVATAKMTGTIFSRNEPYAVGLGADLDNGAWPWLGDYFLSAVYGRALSEDEVMQNYLAGLPSDNSVQAVITADPVSGDAPLTVNFSAEDSSSCHGAIVDYAWDFGDGATGSGLSVSHDYLEGGLFEAVLTVTAGDGAIASSTVLIDVAVPNLPPAIAIQSPVSGQTYTDAEIPTFAALASDSDGSVVSVEFFIDGASIGAGILNATTGYYELSLASPLSAQEDVYLVAAMATDDDGATGLSQDVGFRVESANAAPTVENVTFTMLEDGILSWSLTGQDANGDALTLAIVDAPASGELLAINQEPGENVLTGQYVPPANAFGEVTFTYEASDGQLSSNIGTVIVDVQAVNDAPTGSLPPVTVAEDSDPTIIDLLTAFSDVDDGVGALTFSVQSNSNPGLVTPSISSSSLSLLYAADAEGLSSIVIRGTDPAGDYVDVAFAVTVSDVNDAPVITSSPVTSVDEGTPYSYTITAEDIDAGDVVTITTGSLPAWLSFDGDTLSGTPENTDVGDYSINVAATDADGAMDAQVFTLVVNNVNDAPVALAASLATDEDTALNGTLSGSDDDGDALAFAAATQPVHGALLINPDGSFTYTPVADYNGPDSFTFKVSDASETSDPALVSLTIHPINDLPTAAVEPFTVDEDTPTPVTVNASDVDGDTLAAAISSVSGGTLTGDLLSGYVFTPDENYFGAASFEIEISDGNGGVVTLTEDFTINAINDAPVADALSVETDEDSPIAITLTGSDIDGDSLIYAIVTAPANGSLSGTAPNLTYTPSENYFGEDSFTFTVDDGAETSAVAAVSITVTPVNDAPAFSSAPITVVDEDAAYSYLVSVDDVDAGDTVTITASVLPTWLTFDGTTLSGTPTNDEVGDHDVVLTATDVAGDSVTQSFVIAVINVNDAPVATAATFTTAEDVALSDALSGSDDDGDELTFAVVDSPEHGLVVLNADGSFTYTPSENYFGEDSFTFTVDDGAETSGVAAVSITVTPVNDAPAFSSSPITTVNEDAAYSYLVSVDDVDAGDTVTITASVLPTWLTFDGTTLSGTPTNDEVGDHDVVLTATDVAGDSVTQSFVIAVINVNDTPVATAATFTTAEDVALSDALSGSDDDGDELTFAVVDSPEHGLVVLNTDGSFTYTPAENYFGEDSFTFTVDDGAETSAVAAVSITVTPVNDAPVALADSFEVDEDTSFAGQLAGTDVEEDVLTYAIVTQPSHGSVALGAAGAYEYTPAPNYDGPDSFQFTVSDGAITSPAAEVTIEVRGVNDDPVASVDPFTVTEDTPTPIVVVASDLDGDVLTATILSAENGVLTGNLTDGFLFTPDADYYGAASFAIEIDDGNGGLVTLNESFLIQPANDGPSIVLNDFSTNEDTLYAGSFSVDDMDGDALTVSVQAEPTNGVLTLNTDNTFSYLPSENYFGTDSFTLAVNDGETEVTATANIAVLPVNDAPVALDQTVQTDENVAASITLAGTDVEGSPLTFRISSLPLQGVITKANGQEIASTSVEITAADLPLIYTPPSGFFQVDRFYFVANDGDLDSAEAKVLVSVTPEPRTKTYTVQDDFREGFLENLTTQEDPNYLTTQENLESFNYMWMPIYTRGTIARIDIYTGQVIGEYWTEPNHDYWSIPENPGDPYPSRVALDAQGSVWVANFRTGSIVKIVTPESEQWVDRNGNGELDTSSGLGDLRFWGASTLPENAADVATDELVVMHIETGISQLRFITIDQFNNIWAAGTGGSGWKYFDGETGELLRTEPNNGYGGYGGYIFNDTIFSAGSKFLHWNVNDPIGNTNANWDGVVGGNWSSARDSQGNVWVTKDWHDYIYKYSEDGELIGRYKHGSRWSMGIAIDSNDHVWVSHSHCSKSVGHLLPDGTWVGNVTVANHGPVDLAFDRRGFLWVSGTPGIVQRINTQGGPIGADGVTPVGEVDLQTPWLKGPLWTYGKFTGRSTELTPGAGSWRVTYDSEIPSAQWGSVVWNAYLCNDSDVEVRVRLSENGVNFDEWQTLTLEEPIPAGMGRYIQVEASLTSASTGHRAILNDLTVGTLGYDEPVADRFWTVDPGDDIDGLWPETIQLRGALCRSDHEIEIDPTYSWTQISGPGVITFNDSSSIAPAIVSVTQPGDYVVRFTGEFEGEVRSQDLNIHLVPFNKAPYVNGGDNFFVRGPNVAAQLQGVVRDDGLPEGEALNVTWRKAFGPGGEETVNFSDISDPEATVTFTEAGIYLLELVANDSEFETVKCVEVRVGASCEANISGGLYAWWQANCDHIDHIHGNVGFPENYLDENDEPEPAFADGEVAAGFLFDGVDDRITVFESPSLDIGGLRGLSFEFWVKPDRSRDDTLLEFAELDATGVSIRTYSGDGIIFDVVGEDGTSHAISVDSGLSIGNWNHVAAIWNRGTGLAEIYINGTWRTGVRFAETDFIANTKGDLFFGSNRDNNDAFDGVMDEITMYNRAINPDEVWAIYSAGEIGKCPPNTNLAPEVDAGGLYVLQDISQSLRLNGFVSDDGVPAGFPVEHFWEVSSGPGDIVYLEGDEASLDPLVQFTAEGYYSLSLYATDGEYVLEDVATIVVGQPCEVDAPDSLVAWFKGEGTTQDATGANNGYAINGIAYADGKVGQAMQFNGSRSIRVFSSPEIDLNNSAEGFTIEFWVQPGQDASRNIFSYNELGDTGLSMWFRHLDMGGNFGDDTRYEWYIEQPGGATRIELFDSQILPVVFNRYHFALVYDRTLGVLRMFRDAQLVAETTVGDIEIPTQGDLYIGGYTSWTKFNGLLDEFSIYNQPLAPEEIGAIYAADTVGKCLPSNNQAPVVSAGQDSGLVTSADRLRLQGVVTDDGLPESQSLSISWRQIDGPDGVVFADPSEPQTTATFPEEGLYELELVASDGLKRSSDVVVVQVGAGCGLGASSSLVGWWPGNRNFEDVINGNHGGPVRMSFTNGHVGSAMSFDGTGLVRIAQSDETDLGASAEGFTIDFWVKPGVDASRTVFEFVDPDVSGPRMGFWHEDRGGNFGDDTQNHWFIEQPGGTTLEAVGPVLPVVFDLYHIALVYDRQAGSMRMYRNAVLDAEVIVGDIPIPTKKDLYLGGYPDRGNKFSGYLDEFSIYDRPLQPEQIASTYAAGSTGKCLPTDNAAPSVYAGEDTGILSSTGSLNLSGAVSDDGKPGESPLTIRWTLLNGPASVSFADPFNPTTSVSFTSDGTYELQLSASDGLATSVDVVVVQVGQSCTLGADTDLVAWWPGNRNYDDVIGGHHGGPVRMNFANGHVGSAMHFDGSGYVRVNASPDLDVGHSSDGFTIEFWSDIDADRSASFFGWLGVDGYMNIFHRDMNGGFGDDTRYELNIDQADGSRVSLVGATLEDFNGWRHLAIVYDPETDLLRLYLNAEIYAETIVADLTAPTDGELYLGGYITWSKTIGKLDEFSVYRRALMPEEVSAIYEAGVVGKCLPTANDAPVVYAGEDTGVTGIGVNLTLQGNVVDDGLPGTSELEIAWTQLNGPGTAIFADSSSPVSSVNFSSEGIYELQLSAHDGLDLATDVVVVQVGPGCGLGLSDSLVGWWPGNRSYEDIIFDNDGRPVRMSFTDGHVGSAMNFDGSGYVRIAQSAETDLGASLDGFTIDFWVKPAADASKNVFGFVGPDNSGPRMWFWHEDRGGNFGDDTQYHWRIEQPDGSLISVDGPVLPVVYDLYHIALVYDRAAGVLRMYRNAQLDTELIVGDIPIPTQHDLYLGGYADWGNKFDGYLDEFSIYNRPLLPEEIAATFAAGTTGKCLPTENEAPQVYAGEDIGILTSAGPLTLTGSVTDDGLPGEGALSIVWSLLNGPAPVVFGDVSDPATTASFSADGTYELQLSASDGLATSVDVLVVQVGQSCTLGADTDLVAWWPGNRNYDDVIGGHHGGPVRMSFADGHVASAMRFDGTGYVRVDASSDLDVGHSSDGFTIEFWGDIDADRSASFFGWLGADGYINIFHRDMNGSFGNDTRYELNIDQANGSRVSLVGATLDEYDGWRHFAVVYDPETDLLRLYLNAEVYAEAIVADLTAPTDGELYLGGYITWSKFNGKLDEFSVYRRALMPEEVGGLYAAGEVGKCLPGANEAPVVFAGNDIAVSAVGESVELGGHVVDDGLPGASILDTAWTQLNGPGVATLVDPASPTSSVSFSAEGVYELELSAHDGQAQSSDVVVVQVGPGCGLGASDALVGWWPGNRSYEDVASGNDGGPVRMSFSDGHVGSAMNFDGSGYVRIAQSAETDLGASLDGFAIDFWVKPAADASKNVFGFVGPDNSGPRMWFWHEDRGGHFGDDTQYHWRIEQPDGSLISIDGPVLPVVYDLFHIALVYDRAAGALRMYRNAQLDTELIVGDIPIPTQHDLYLGGYADWGNKFDGYLDEFSIYDRPLTQAEVTATYSMGASGKCLTDPVNRAPQLQLGQDITLRRPTTQVTVTASAFDDGLPTGTLSGTWAQLSGPAGVSFSDANPVFDVSGKDTLLNFPAEGVYELQLSVTDGEFSVTDSLIVSVLPPINQAPTVELGDPFEVSILDGAALAGIVTDDGFNEGAQLTGRWLKQSGPGSVTFNQPINDFGTLVGTPRNEPLSTNASFSEAGAYVLAYQLTDGEFTVRDTQVVTVIEPENLPPMITVSGGATIHLANSTPLIATATDDGLPVSGSLTYQWRKISGPGAAVFENALALETNVSFTQRGIYQIEFSASDGAKTGSESVTISVIDPPYVELDLTNNGVVIAADQVFPFSAFTYDIQDGVSSVEFFANGDSIGFGNRVPNSDTYRLSLAGSSLPLNTPLDITVTSTDSLGDSATDGGLRITVLDGNVPNPDALITSPTEGQEITAPTDVIGSVTSDILDNYVLETRLKNTSDWTVIGSGTEAIEDGTIGSFDPTLLRNGIYDIRLTATDLLGRSVSDTISVVVDTGMKIGHFTLAFEDLSIPVSGIPVQLLRAYDSRGALQGDFGLGWDLGIRTVQVYENRTIGARWVQDSRGSGLGQRLFYSPAEPIVVSVVLGDDQVEQFEAYSPTENAAIIGQWPFAAQISFRPINGSVGQLSHEEAGINFSIIDSGDGTFQFDDFEGVYDPDEYVYTSPDGTKLEIQEIVGLRKVTDRNQNILTITESSITHSSGKSITFTRDAAGRITEITDPDGGVLRYTYDAQGRLSRFTDRTGTDTQSPLYGLYTEFRYQNANFPNHLTSIIDPRGIEAIASEYDGDGRLIVQKDADGNEIGFVHDIPNRKETITDRLGNVTVHEYDLQGNVVATTTVDPNNPDGPGLTTTYEYDANRNETRIVDPLGNVTEMAYDLATNNLLTETQYVKGGDGNPVAMTTTYTYDNFSNPLTITDAEGKVTDFDYDPATGDLLTMTDAEDNPTSFTYDGAGNLKTMTDADGNVTTNTYNGSGYVTLTQVRDADGVLLSSSTFTYDGRGNQTSQSQRRTLYDQQGNVLGTENVTTQFAYDREDRVIRTTFHDGTFTTTTYNDFGQVATQTDQENETTFMFYDDRGNLTRTAYPDNTEERTYYDLENRRVAMTDRRGYTTYFVYDELGRMIATIFPDATTPDPATLDLSDSLDILGNADLADNPMSETLYDEIGRVAFSFDERGNPTTYEYDPNCGCSGRRGTVTNALNQTTSFAYSLNGNQLSVTDANLHTTQFEYDDLNRPTKTIFHDNTITETVYDELGRRSATIDQEGKRTEYVYDGLGRLVTVLQPDPDAAAAFIETHYGYDELGNQISQTDAEGRTTYYQYDSLGRRVARTLPEGQTETYTYYNDGALKTRTDFNGYTTTYEYDKLNRMTASIADPTHPSLELPHAAARIDFVYTDSGQRRSATVTNADGVVLDYQEWLYDERDRLTDHLTPRGDLSYTYDASGNLKSVDSGNVNGVELAYDYDVLNRLETVYDAGAAQPALEHDYGYDDVGNLQSLAYANGVTHTWTYNSLNRLTNLVQSSGSGTLYGYTYELRDSGHRSRQTETSGRVVDYTYDNLYRLTSETITNDPFAVNGVSSWTYDDVGNRLTQTSTLPDIAAQNETYSDNDWLDGAIYDDNGNTTLEDGNADVYDFMNRLVRRTTSGGSVIDITYDADGNRITKSAPAGVTHYLVDMNNLTGYAQVLEELDSTLTTERVYTYGLDLIAQHQLMPVDAPTGWETSYYLYDGLGTVRALADENGSISDAYTYDAWGNLINTQGLTPNSYLFTGEQWDHDLGMYFLRARYMNPETGRFHTLDTFEGRNADPLTLHKYLYAHANPVMFVDPSGNETIAGLMIGFSVKQVLAASVALTFAYMWAVSPQFRLQVLNASGQAVALLKSNLNKMRTAIRDVAKKIGETVKKVLRMPKFFVIKSIMPQIYSFNVGALATNPSWHVLRYNGIRSPRTKSNRRWIMRTYRHLRAAAPKGYQLDEFPFASTHRGGPFGPALGRMVQASDNRKQGGYLGAFYLLRLKGKSQPFLVVPVGI
ncbi:tandem-95 repeat protein [Cerasicoccus fimbriatus]|uniref:tandem-95 repeat protein n=1 Tax=Cerasicoccus fimbriatus TaxID=3014554 RepID=UPI0022B4D428|nr:Ig-like domain-containing protein [Cerasicoccus sp. TK19100]